MPPQLPRGVGVHARTVERRRALRAPRTPGGGGVHLYGVVEEGYKVAIAIRCKRAGMHWTGAGAIIALRCCTLSGRFEDLWERRSAARTLGRMTLSHDPDVRPGRSWRPRRSSLESIILAGVCAKSGKAQRDAAGADPWTGAERGRIAGRHGRGARAAQRCAGPQLVTRLAIALAFLLVASPAWAQTPTLVQHYYTGTNAPPRGLTATNYTFRLPNKTLSGNCLIMFLDYPHGVSVSSITDDGPNTLARGSRHGGWRRRPRCHRRLRPPRTPQTGPA